MSLLLKALEKTEDGKELEAGSTEQAGGEAAAAPAAGGLGGMKLSGGGPSKLGSALSSTVKGKAAKEISSAYTEDAGDDGAAEQELVAAQRRNIIRNGVLAAVFVAVLGGGWFAYQKFAVDPFGQEGEVAAVTTTATDQSEQQQGEVDDAVFLPLAEPIYDIQENILTASVAGAEISEGQADLASEVESYVEKILQEQLRRNRQSLSVDDEVVVHDSDDDEIADRLSQAVNWEEVEVLSADATMLAKLESLQSRPFVSGKQYVRKQGVALPAELAAAEKATGEADGAMKAEKAMKAKPVAQITAKSSGLDKVMERGAVQYRAGDLSGSEISFRTVLASEPRNSNALVGLARVHQARGNQRLAVATLLKAAEYSPNSDLVVSELIAVQSSTSTSVLASGKIYEILARTNDTVIQSKLMFILGNTLAANKDWSSAKSMFHAANELNPTNPDIAYNLAVVLDYLGDQKRAAKLYHQALRSALVRPSSFNHQVAESRANEISGN